MRRGRPPKPKSDLPESLEADIARLRRMETRKAYGMMSDRDAANHPQHSLELAAFHLNPQQGLGRLKHFQNYLQAICPPMKRNWNPWFERMVGSLCRDHHIYKKGDLVVRATSWTGCGAAGKTFCSGIYAAIWWLCDPQNSVAVLTSTSRDAVRKRVWTSVHYLLDNLVDPNTGARLAFPGVTIESRTTIQADRGDDLHAIFALPVAEGETARAVARIKGFHAPRMLLIIDEAEGTPEAIFEVIHNWTQGARDLTLLFLGNATSHLNAHGQVCEPLRGWGSIKIEDDSWPTKGVERWFIPPGICEHFDGARSPNVLLGRNQWSFLYSTENWEMARDKKERSIGWWSNNRGFWPPEGTCNTILSEGMLVRCGVDETPPLVTRLHRIAFFDPAFGGDDARLRFADLGPTEEIPEGVILFGDSLSIDPTPDPGEEVEFALARRVQHECEKRGVLPEHFGVDAVGIGQGVAAVLATRWSNRINKFYSVGAPTDDIIVWEDSRPAKDVFDRAATENWFRVRGYCEGRQLKGIGVEASAQLCTRTYEIRGRKNYMSTKAECRQELGRSPDDADALVGLCWLARQFGVVPRNMSKTTTTPAEQAEEEAAESQWDLDLAYTREEMYQ